jgi:hypothetical protein
MPPSWILAYYSIDRLALATLVNFWTHVTFEPLDRFFQNLVANCGPTRAISRNVQIYQNPICSVIFRSCIFWSCIFSAPQFHIAPSDQTGLDRYPRSIERISSSFYYLPRKLPYCFMFMNYDTLLCLLFSTKCSPFLLKNNNFLQIFMFHCLEVIVVVTVWLLVCCTVCF